jgi:nitrite reductase/ring-hydroxylating ferredoxin subunit
MLRQILIRLEQARVLDGVSDWLQRAVGRAARPQAARDLLHGTWLGHPAHPMMVQVPVGAFLSAAALDLVPGGRRGATTLIALGAASTPPAMAAGLVDWSEMTRDRRRVGLVHATANTVALGLYLASLAARRSGRYGRGRTLAFAGLAAVSGGAYLGGHLAYAQGGGMNHAAPEVDRLPEDWTTVAQLSELPEGKPTVRRIDDVPILLYRLGDRVTALIERCAHETGPLGEGEVVGSGADACVVCPWHGSTFRLVDGLVVHGPAGNDQPTLRARVRAGAVEVAQP